MRNSFARFITEKTLEDKSIKLIVGDIGFRIFDDFREKHPKNFLNAGIAEQNMISVAAGMASEGSKAFVYTITPFLVMRAFEQIRVDIGINNQPCVLVGVGGGLAYDKLGPTHHAYEDLALMQSIPQMNIFVPFDPVSTIDCLEQAYEKISQTPSYVRLSKGGEPTILPLQKISKNIYLLFSKNSKNIIITHGSIANKLLEFANEHNMECTIYAITAFGEEVDKLIEETISSHKNCRKIIFIEECYKIGSYFHNFLSFNKNNKNQIIIENIHLPQKYIFDINDRETMLQKNGFTYQKLSSLLVT